ncbi:NADP-dependent oxidoreductase [Nocardioides pantholopis]|uniref:NADP-dependent oxidoreductase n=1 Tax=Nocardioides pantholopis TaxID=2483798 RepID=UPI000F096754|nr:NADP-dependent oxidoreductase [Nocardioides pantholopis]
MHAYTLTTYGPAGLVPADVPEPDLGPGQVKVRVEQIAVNPLDWKIRNGYLAEMLPLSLPAVIGTDIAGTVLAIGDGPVDGPVDGLAVGDRVVGFADSGGFAEVAVTRAQRLAVVPDALDLQSAVAVATAAETAQRVLGLIDLAPASTVVVNGAAGAVGSAVTQLLVAAGHRVLGTASPANHDYVRSLGAEPVGYGDFLVEDLRDHAPDGVHAAIDTAGRGFVERTDGLIPAERIVTTVDFAASARGAIVAGGDPTQLTAQSLRAVLDRAAAGAFTVHIDSVHPFEQLGAALARSEAGHLRGKLVVTGPAS